MIALLLSSAAVFSNFQNVTVAKTVDGDTFEVSMPELPAIFANMKVRVSGIDAPEMKAARKCEKKDALIAKEALEKLIGNNKVDLNFCGPDKYFRLNCAARVNGTDIGSFQLDAKRSVPYSGAVKKPKWTCFTGLKE